MSPRAIFAFQFFWFLAAWAVVVTTFVLPKLRELPVEDALAVSIAPQLFRVLGAGLLVPQLAPGMPRSFSIPTAAGDSLTAALALVSLIALARRRPFARSMAWACNLVGVADLSIALPHAMHIGAAQFLTAQWYVPALVVPLMIVSHVVAFRILLRRL